MTRVIIAGGGWAGCGAALAAAKAGAGAVILLEKTDSLLGTGLVGGIMRNNGRYTATEEMIAMGSGELFLATDRCARHAGIEFPGPHRHASLYDVTRIEPEVRRVLLAHGVQIHLTTRATDVVTERVSAKEKRITAVEVHRKEGAAFAGPEYLEGDVFVEATGSVGPQAECARFGNGCVMCVIRCPTFGGRISIAERAGVPEMIGGSSAGTLGAFSGSCKLIKESLAPWIVAELERHGVCKVPLPAEFVQKEKLVGKACQQYAGSDFAENLILLDTGHAKLMTSYFSLERLRQIPGFENARYDDPYSGSMGNSVRYLAMSPRDNYLKVDGIANLFCGGEKAGPLVGHTEAIVTGILAGHNAVRHGLGLPLLQLPRRLAIGEAIAYVGDQVRSEGGLFQKYTFSGAGFFQRMQELGLYTTDQAEIGQRVAAAGLTGIFAERLATGPATALAGA